MSPEGVTKRDFFFGLLEKFILDEMVCLSQNGQLKKINSCFSFYEKNVFLLKVFAYAKTVNSVLASPYTVVLIRLLINETVTKKQQSIFTQISSVTFNS